ncbi:MAG TPA: BatD family protein [Sulfurovum sp.]|uniref:BatD family protein n=1 Tax=Sulfurovum sp. TaxID=1969726 RepID=UPI002F92DD67
MQNLGKVLWIITLSLQWLWSASVEATVSSTEVVSGNAVQLRIKAVGDDAVFPDIQRIDGHKIEGTHSGSSSSYSFINGEMKSEHATTKTFTFVPTKDVNIPSYEIEIDGKVYKTDPIKVTVIKSNAPVGQNGDLFSLQMQANKTRVMVGESLMVTVYFSLKNGVRLSQDIQYTQPTFPGFIVTEGGEQNAYIKGNYQVQEVRYMLTAQEEGNFTATPAHARVGIADGSRRDIFGMTFGTTWKQAASNTLEIEVLPQPKESDLVGDFTVETTIDAQEVKANKPVNLTVKLEGKGNLESFEFPKYEIDGVTVYSDEAKVETKVVDGEIYSTYSKSFAFIAEEDFTIPERHFSMLSLKDRQIKTVKVNGYAVTIKKTKSAAATAETAQMHGVVQTKTEPAATETTAPKQAEVKSVAWWMLAVAFGSGALFMMVLQRLPRFKTRSANPYKESEALKILYTHMSEDPQVEAMVRKLYARKNGDKSVEIDKKLLKEMVEKYR